MHGRPPEPVTLDQADTKAQQCPLQAHLGHKDKLPVPPCYIDMPPCDRGKPPRDKVSPLGAITLIKDTLILPDSATCPVHGRPPDLANQRAQAQAQAQAAPVVTTAVPTCDVPDDVLEFEDTLNISISIAPDRFANCNRESLILFKDSNTLASLLSLNETCDLGDLGNRLNTLHVMLNEAIHASSAR